MRILTRDETDYETEYVTREEAESKIRKLECELAEARRIADAYRGVWESVRAAVDETPNDDPLPWWNAASEPRRKGGSDAN